MTNESFNEPADGSRAGQALDRALAALAPRRAPADLQARVFAALAARRAAHWWQLPLVDWPPLARAAVLATCVLALLPLWGLVSELSQWLLALRQSAPVGSTSALWHGLQSVAEALRATGAALFGQVPRWMAYGALSAGVWSVIVCAAAAWWMARNLRAREFAS